MAEYNCEVLALIDDHEIDERHRLQARIVSWNNGPPVFELRPMHLKEGVWRHGQHYVKLKKEHLSQIIDDGVLVKAYEAFKEIKAPEKKKK